MKQLYLKTLAFLILSIVCVNVNAYDAFIDGIYYNFLDDKAIVTAYKKPSFHSREYKDSIVIRDTNNDYLYKGEVSIPSSVKYESKTYAVTEIGEGAFYDCIDLTSVIIPNSITSIGEYAFSCCWYLKNIMIPESVINIGRGALSATLWYYSQPVGVVYAGKVAIGYKSEMYDIRMPEGTHIDLKEGTVNIADGAFESCSGLTSITIPNSVTGIGSYAFRGCSGLTSITIPNSVTSIGSYAFRGCSGLTAITIPNSVTGIGNGAFEDCI